MSVDTIRQQLATLEALIAGVNRAYDTLPRGPIVEADLPLFLNFVRDATYDWRMLGASDNIEIRQYILWLLVMPIQLAAPGEGEEKAMPFIKTVMDYFKARPQLGGTAQIQNAIITGDSGPKQLPWADTYYWGIEFRLQVTEYQLRAYAADE